MKELLVLREQILKLYQKGARVIHPLVRFLVSFVVFFLINQMIGYNPALRHGYVLAVLSVIGTVLPMTVLLFIAAFFVVMHVAYVSITLALVLGMMFALLYFIYVRFVPTHGYVILAVPLLYVLKIPYVVPLVLGLLSTPVAMLPMFCGIMLYYTMHNMIAVIGTATGDTLTLYSQVIQQMFSSRELYLTIGIMITVLLVVYWISNLAVNYSYELSIGAGAFINILLFLIGKFVCDLEIDGVPLVLETLVSAGIAWVVQFMRLTLNYSGVEYLQFEDDEYYYYVRAVPKVNIAAPKKKVKRFNAHIFADGHFGLHPEEPVQERQEQPEKDGQETDAMDDMLEKHDFDFKVSVEEEDFQSEEK